MPDNQPSISNLQSATGTLQSPAPPAVADAGFRLVVTGTGLSGLLIVNVWEFELPPPGAGVNTVTGTVPAVAMSEDRIAAVSLVADMKVVVRSDPFHRTTEPATNPLPSTVSVKPAPPAVADEGLRLFTTGGNVPVPPERYEIVMS